MLHVSKYEYEVFPVIVYVNTICYFNRTALRAVKKSSSSVTSINVSLKLRYDYCKQKVMSPVCVY